MDIWLEVVEEMSQPPLEMQLACKCYHGYLSNSDR
jgi:hypothetical protein